MFAYEWIIRHAYTYAHDTKGGTGGWWQRNEEAPSDQELEATAQSWLKSTGLQSGLLSEWLLYNNVMLLSMYNVSRWIVFIVGRSVGGASLQVTLPSAAESKIDDYSKDSLEVSGRRKR